MQSNKRKLNLLLFLAACFFISVAATKPTATHSLQPSAAKDTTHWKNLKILPKDISEDSLDEIMHGYSRALGVRCNFCHAMGSNGHPDFASDAKEEKEVARYMMTMTAGINKTYFNSENSTRADTLNVVKCITCHHGNAHPDETNQMGGNNGNPPGDSNHKMPPPPPPPHQ